jgi:outer membrane biosynthesis protein TonB
MRDILATNKKRKLFHIHLKSLSLQINHRRKYFFYPIIFIILLLPLIPNNFVPHLKAATMGQYIQSQSPSTSFSFTAGGDIGGNSNTSTALDLIAQSGSQFDLALGDLSYSEISPESAWCSYVQSRVGSTFPFELISGNHDDGGEVQDGLIDNFTQCLPDRLGAVGTYGKEYYFDYPAASPIARFIMISPDLTFTNGGAYSYGAGTDHYNWVSNTIDNARAAGIKWVIVGMHKVCISMGTAPCEIGNDLFNLLVSKKVDLILQAHDHSYQRSKQLALNSTTCTAIQAETYNSNCVVNDGSTGNYTEGAGPVDVIMGTIGEGLFDLDPTDGDAGYFAKWMGNNINPTNGLTKFTLSSDQLTVSANFIGSTAPNNFSDSFTITDPTATPTPTPTQLPGGGIALRATAIGNNGAGDSNLTIGLPAGTSSGDVMVAHMTVQPAGNVITAPAGWNLVIRQDSGSLISTATYVKVAGATEPASYSWTFGTAGQEASGGIASYIGVDTTTPIDASQAQYNAASSNVDNSGVTTTSANDMLVYAVGVIAAVTVNVPTGFTEKWRTSSNSETMSEMSQQLLASVGATGTIHGTLNSANTNITMLLALKPAGTTPTPTPTPTSTATATPTATATSTPTPTPTSVPTSTPTPTPVPGGGIVLRTASASNNGTGGATLTLTVPTGTSSGDVMVAHVIVQTAGNVITAPAGWNLVLRQDSSSSISTATYVKVAGASEPASYSWTFGTAGQASGGIASYIGVNTSSPIDASHAQYNASSSNVDNSGVTTTSANDMLVYAVGVVTVGAVNAPSGFTEEWRSSNAATTSELLQEPFASVGATGTIHGTLNTANSNITLLLALKPAGTTSSPPSGISLRAATANTNGSGGATLTLTVPTGTSSGDVMVAHVIVQTAGNVITAPAGWNLVLRQDSSSSISTALYVKVAGATEPTSYSWTFGTAGQASGGIASYIGVNTSSPIDASHAQYNASSSNVNNSGVTTTTTNDMLVYAVGIVVPATVNVPSGFTEKWWTGSNSATTSEMSQELFTSVGATGTIHGTLNTANSNITLLLALKPAGTTPTPTPTPTSTPTPTPTPTSTPTPTPTPTSTPTPTPTPTSTPTPLPGGGISLRAATASNNGAGAATLTLNTPVGTSSGDVLVAHVIVQTAGNAMTAPAGWSLVLRQDSSSSISTATYVKVAGSSEPASYSWNFGKAGQASGGLASYIGVDTTTPVDASHAQYNASSSNVDNSGVTTTTANDMLVYAVGIVAVAAVNVPSGFTEKWWTGSNSATTSEMSQELFATGGASGTIHGTLNTANSNITMLIALKPAG